MTATLLIGAGVAGAAYWWLSGRTPSPDVVPAPVSDRFARVKQAWQTIDAIQQMEVFANNEEAGDALRKLKSILVEQLKT